MQLGPGLLLRAATLAAVTSLRAPQQDTRLLLDTEISKHCLLAGGMGQIMPGAPPPLPSSSSLCVHESNTLPPRPRKA